MSGTDETGGGRVQVRWAAMGPRRSTQRSSARFGSSTDAPARAARDRPVLGSLGPVCDVMLARPRPPKPRFRSCLRCEFGGCRMPCLL